MESASTGQIVAALALASWCPDCPPAQAARALVLSETFWANAGYALLPFIVIGMAIRWFVVRIDRSTEGIDADD